MTPPIHKNHKRAPKKTCSKETLEKVVMFIRNYAKGKRNAKVPILLTTGMKEEVELLLRVRHLHRIAKDNPYLFARPYPAVHRQFYRLLESAIELTKVSRILLAVDQGKASQFSGKGLRDISIEGKNYDKINKI